MYVEVEQHNFRPYKLMVFEVERVSFHDRIGSPGNIPKLEHVFVCLLKQKHNPNRVFRFFVSKAYGAFDGLHAHRFVFLTDDKNHQSMMLVEGSAEVHKKTDFNVELHYLELRKHHQPSEF